MYIQAFVLFFLFIVPIPRTEAQNEQVEGRVIRNIVFMRTEGLGMAELFYSHSKDKKIRELCSRIKSYYTATQPDAVELCTGKNLQLAESEFELLYGRLQKGFEGYDSQKEGAYLEVCEDHINKSITFYTQLVQDAASEDISYFSFKALPELFNLQQEIRKVRKQYPNPLAKAIP
ncbi:hypothetical protein [Sphingobacterium paucimobilis]|uniref:DUF4142 domain-containing protein n=1 Tax=Sphingobacterium paucimobilis HER1398 TaxID=1346330 RepID=U2H6F9_9SPHI|nr:hypothetical protein [Sphingobacterium paucimobilis]ERJ57291.1 hypothetical protein M472_00785 [Sphingobacterium paucimobilis HER1398]